MPMRKLNPTHSCVKYKYVYGCIGKRLQHMNKLLAISIASASIAIGATSVLAGVPQSESISNNKWQKMNETLWIDTKDVNVEGDQIRFWAERVPTQDEQASTQYNTAWKGKIRIRCGDFNTRIDSEGFTRSGIKRIFNGDWERIRPDTYAYTLASNFCYLTSTPGFTPEPIVHQWQRSLTAEIRKQLTPEAIKKRKIKECSHNEKIRDGFC